MIAHFAFFVTYLKKIVEEGDKVSDKEVKTNQKQTAYVKSTEINDKLDDL